VNDRPARTAGQRGGSAADLAPNRCARTCAPLQKSKRIFRAASHLPVEISRCASCKYGVDGGQQIRCDGSFEDEAIGSRFNRRELRILLLVDAESDQFQRREMAPDSAHQPQPISPSQREIDHGNGIARSFLRGQEQRSRGPISSAADLEGFGFIDVKSVDKYEDNWDILK